MLRFRDPDALQTYQTITGAVFDDETGLLRLTPAQFANLESLFFQIGDVSVPDALALGLIELTLDHPVRPPSSSPRTRRSSRVRCVWQPSLTRPHC